jgi:hypothetical protein
LQLPQRKVVARVPHLVIRRGQVLGSAGCQLSALLKTCQSRAFPRTKCAASRGRLTPPEEGERPVARLARASYAPRRLGMCSPTPVPVRAGS